MRSASTVRSGKSMREVYVDGLANVLDTLWPCRRFIYISSTSVYGQTEGGIVDETSPTEPTEESGTIVLEAERLLALEAAGRDRSALRRHLWTGPTAPSAIATAVRRADSGDPERWLNLIHVDDGAEAILAAEVPRQAGRDVQHRGR